MKKWWLWLIIVVVVIGGIWIWRETAADKDAVKYRLGVVERGPCKPP